MATIVVLGMHGGGTSLVAGMLYVAGVAMNPNPKGYIARKNYKTYEDAAFVRLNAGILHAAGGNWRKPPDPKRLETLPDRLAERMLALIDAREAQHELWGFKDPRTALTVQLYHPRLYEPRYVVVKRDFKAVASSLATRTKRMGDPVRWFPLVETYYKRIQRFLEHHEPMALHISYEALVYDHGEIKRLIEFTGIDGVDGAVRQAAKMVKM